MRTQGIRRWRRPAAEARAARRARRGGRARRAGMQAWAESCCRCLQDSPLSPHPQLFTLAPCRPRSAHPTHPRDARPASSRPTMRPSSSGPRRQSRRPLNGRASSLGSQPGSSRSSHPRVVSTSRSLSRSLARMPRLVGSDPASRCPGRGRRVGSRRAVWPWQPSALRRRPSLLRIRLAG